MIRRSFALLVLAAAAAVPARAEAVVIKLATLVPQGSEWHRVLQEMGAEWQKVSNGQVTVRLYPGGVAGDDADVVRKMRLGTLNAAFMTSVGFQEIDRSVIALQMPLVFENYAEFDCTMAKYGPELEKALADKGFVVLGWADGGFVRFFSKNPVRTPADLRAQKLFTWAGDDQYIELWKQAGFNPIPLPSTEISTALSTGLVNALPAPPAAAAALQWYTNAKNMTDIPWGVLLGGLVVSKSAWEKIPADVRGKLEASARAAAVKLSKTTREAEPRDIAAMQKRGLVVIKPDAAAMTLWRKMVAETLPKLRGAYVPAEPLDRVLAARDACRAGGSR